MAETVGCAGVGRTHVDRQKRAEGIEPAPVRANIGNGRELADLGCVDVLRLARLQALGLMQRLLGRERLTVGAVTGRAVAGIDLRAASGLVLIDGVGVAWRLDIEQPGLDAAKRGEIDGGRRGAGGESGVLVALDDLAVVAVPVQMHAGLLPLVPDRREIHRCLEFLFGQFVHGEIEVAGLAGVEGVGAPRPPFRFLQHPLETAAQRQQLFAHDPDSQRIDCVAVDQVQILAARLHQPAHFRNDVVLAEPGVGTATEEKFLERQDVEGLRRHSRVEFGWALCRVAHGAGMAGGAIHEGAIDALVAAPGHADGQVTFFSISRPLVNHAQRRIALARQMGGAHLRQRLPDPIGKAEFVLAAGGAIFELLFDVSVFARRIAEEALRHINDDND